MSVVLYQCNQCGKDVTTKIIDIESSSVNWFALFELKLCSEKCLKDRDQFIKSLTR